jgi:putative hydrolase of the HAD superfamily
VNSPESPRAIKGIIFDIGRVIVRLDPARAMENLIGLQEPGDRAAFSSIGADKFWAAIQSDPRWQDWQEGRITPREWHEHTLRRLGISLGFDAFCAAWNRTLDPQIMIEEEIFADLAARYQLGLLSNTDPLHVETLEQHFLFVRHFAVRIYSCRVGICKPSPAIYQAVLDSLGIAPSEALYIDDIPEFAAVARRLGVDAITFRGRANLLPELRRRGLLTR